MTYIWASAQDLRTHHIIEQQRPEPSLLAYMKYGCRLRPKLRG